MNRWEGARKRRFSAFGWIVDSYKARRVPSYEVRFIGVEQRWHGIGAVSKAVLVVAHVRCEGRTHRWRCRGFCVNAFAALFTLRASGRRIKPLRSSRRSRPSQLLSRQNDAQSARARRFLRGVANPCARAPFWHPTGIPAGGSGGMSVSCWWALSGFSYCRTPASRIRSRGCRKDCVNAVLMDIRP